MISGGSTAEQQKIINKILEELNISPFDQILVHEEKAIGIEHIRILKRKLFLTSVTGGKKAALLYDFDKASIEAQNSFLKTLEEPPPNTYIILTAQNSDTILPTIISRAKVIAITNVARNASDKDSEIIRDILKLTGGSIGEKMLMAEKYGKNREDALLFLDTAIYDMRNQLLNLYSHKKNTDCQPVYWLAKIKKFLKAREFLNLNTNPKLTLEVLFLGLN